MKQLMTWWKKLNSDKLEKFPIKQRSFVTEKGEVCFSKATTSDIQAILAVERDVYFGELPWTYSNFLMEISVNPNAIFLIAKMNDKVVGFIGVRQQKSDLHISNLAVVSINQRLGIGEELINYSIRIAKKAKLNRISLEVKFSNKSAQAFYRKLGFTSEKILKNYYTDENEDGIEMIYQID